MSAKTIMQTREPEAEDAREAEYVFVREKGESRATTSSDFFHLLLAFPRNQFTVTEFSNSTGRSRTTIHKWFRWAERRGMIRSIGKTKFLVSDKGTLLGKSIRYSTLYRRTVKVSYDP